MYLIIRKADSAVVGTNYAEPPAGAHDSELFEVKFWAGPEPAIHRPEEGVDSYDPTIGLDGSDERLHTIKKHFLAGMEVTRKEINLIRNKAGLAEYSPEEWLAKIKAELTL